MVTNSEFMFGFFMIERDGMIGLQIKIKIRTGWEYIWCLQVINIVGTFKKKTTSEDI